MGGARLYLVSDTTENWEREGWGMWGLWEDWFVGGLHLVGIGWVAQFVVSMGETVSNKGREWGYENDDIME